MKFKVGDVIYYKGSPSYIRRIIQITDRAYINIPFGPGSIAELMKNTIEFTERNFVLATKLQKYLIGLEDESEV
jgi:hypothetical protein